MIRLCRLASDRHRGLLAIFLSDSERQTLSERSFLCTVAAVLLYYNKRGLTLQPLTPVIAAMRRRHNKRGRRQTPARICVYRYRGPSRPIDTAISVQSATRTQSCLQQWFSWKIQKRLLLCGFDPGTSRAAVRFAATCMRVIEIC